LPPSFGIIFDAAIRMAEHLAFFFGAFDQLLLALRRRKFFQRFPKLLGRGRADVVVVRE
jgi:hypothetical protein